MPLTLVNLDNRRYQDLLDEALARVPVHSPEWTNFNKSDPGVTLISVFAFLAESLLYRCNQIPDRNRVKFLQLLGIPLQEATSARGLVSFSNERGPLATITLNDQLEVRSGQVPFRTEKGLDVLPVEAQIFFKQPLPAPSPQTIAYYTQLYASFGKPAPDFTQPLLYQTTSFPLPAGKSLSLGTDTVDKSLWIALLARPSDKLSLDDVRQAIGGKTLNLGIVPYLMNATRKLTPGTPSATDTSQLVQYQIPNVPPGGLLPQDTSQRTPAYKLLEAIPTNDVLSAPGVVQITLPPAPELILWSNLDPLEGGVGDFPPTLEDTNVSDRVITWIRVRAGSATQAQLYWAGINTVFATQRTHIDNELLPQGSGEPDQVVRLSKTPVLRKTVKLIITSNDGPETWDEINDLADAGPEVVSPELRDPPGIQPAPNTNIKVFTVDKESGEIHFGDGTHGARPAAGAIIRASYDYGAGLQGDVAPGSINSSPVLPAGLKISNPLRTWGGAEAETVDEGEKQISRYLQHRDRLVTATDFETITLRTPGVAIGRVEVIPAYSPELSSNEPGDAPGAVTLLIIPSYDPDHPETPEPDRLFLDTICDYLDARRLVTTEVFLRGPEYRDIWISVGITVVAGYSVADVRENVKSALRAFLSPLPSSGQEGLPADPTPLLTASEGQNRQRGWPLATDVVQLELWAAASRVDGVRRINNVLLAQGTQSAQSQVTMSGLQLPRIAGISVVTGDPKPLDELRGIGAQSGGTSTFLPLPVTAEECK